MKITNYLLFGALSLLFLSACKDDCGIANNDYVFDYCEGKEGTARPVPEIDIVLDCADGGPAYFVSGCFSNQNCSDRFHVFEQMGFVYAKDNPTPTINDHVIGVNINEIPIANKDIEINDSICGYPIPFTKIDKFEGLDVSTEVNGTVDGKPREIKVTGAILPNLAEGTYYISPYVIDFFGCKGGESNNAAQQEGNEPDTRENYFQYQHVRKFVVNRLSNLGQYLSLKGIGYAEISQPPTQLQNEAGEFTVSFWMRTADEVGFFMEHDDLEVFVSGNHMGVKVNNNIVLSSEFDSQQVNFADGEWHRFTIARSISEDNLAKVKVILDGEILHVVGPLAADSFSSAPIVVGARFNEETSTSENIVSLAPVIDIDEIAIWNKDVSGSLYSLNQLFCPIDVNNPNLVAYWGLNEDGSPSKGTQMIDFDNTEQFSFKSH